MSKNRYESKRTTTRFKQIGQGLRAGEDRIREQRKTEIDAIKLAKLQSDQNSQRFISGLDRKLQSEEQNTKELQKLEARVREHKYEALKKKADTDVARIEGQAAEYGKEAERWAKLTPMYAKAAQQLATKGLAFADYLKGKAEWESEDVDGKLKAWGDGSKNIHLSVFKQGTDGRTTFSLEGDIESQAAIGNRIKLSSKWARNKLYEHIKEHKKLWVNDITVNFGGGKDDPNTPDIDESTIDPVEMLDAGARAILRDFGMSEKSPEGVKIIKLLRSEGSSIKYNNWLGAQVVRTENDTIEWIQNFLTAEDDPSTPEDEKDIAWRNLLLTVQNGFYNTNGKINNPNLGERLDPGSALFESLKKVIDHSHKKYDTFADFKDAILTNRLTLNTGKPGEKREQVLNRFGFKIDNELEPYFSQIKKQEVKKLDDSREQLGNSKIIDFTNRRQEAINNNEWNIDTKIKFIEEAAKLDIDLKDKNKIYKMAFPQYEAFGNFNDLLNFQKAVSEGDEFAMLGIFSSLSKENQRKVAPTVAIIKRINEQSSVGYANEIRHINKQINEKVATYLQSGKVVHSSVDGPGGVHQFFNARVLERMGADPKLSYADAVKAEWAEFKDAMDNPRNKNNPYHNRRAEDARPGSGQKLTVFSNFVDADTNRTALVEEYITKRERRADRIKQDLANVDVEDTDKDIKGIQIIELNNETIDEVLTQKGGLSKLYEQVRLVSPHNIDAFVSRLEEDSLDPSSSDSLMDYVPEKLKYIHQHARKDGKPISLSSIVNAFLKTRKIPYRVSTDFTDAAQLRRGPTGEPEVVNPYIGFNSIAESYFRSANALGGIPMEFNVDKAVNSKMTWTEAYQNLSGIRWSENSYGGYDFTDKEAFLSEPSALPFMNEKMAMSLGLMYWDDETGWSLTQRKKEAMNKGGEK